MLKIRLARGGAKKRPYYHIVIADSHSPRDGKFIEKIGNYNPLLKKDDEKRIVLDAERAKDLNRVGVVRSEGLAVLTLAGVVVLTVRKNTVNVEYKAADLFQSLLEIVIHDGKNK